ncbi:class I SAM-dependent methyltransferase [Streptomonospora alba]|uniref:class I SAM-dependent methyltransferase n=1 Tax=Streptomonospora alba TaxID=183763 RepID=UPI0006999464|nr:class I SAM-dependent methyltransferase [Streptomonospora alba]
MSAHENGAFAPDWLALREGADAAARSTELLEPLKTALRMPAADGPLVVVDLGCGTGAMGRWLAPRLAGPQHWVLYDRDPGLLAHAREGLPEHSADGGPTTAEPRIGDLAQLSAADLAGASLVTASALLDLLTAEQAADLARACAEAGCPALLTLSVEGRVELEPAHPLDRAVATAFDAHQRRGTAGGRLLGPDAPAVTAAAFERSGARVHDRPSPWRLGADDAALTAEWLRGRVSAAVEQRPDLADAASAYLDQRLEQCAAGRLHARIGHRDLLAVPARPGDPPPAPDPQQPAAP